MTNISESTLCPFCGADSRKHCDLEEETGGFCPWEESGMEGDDEADHARREREAEARHYGGLSPLGNALVRSLFPEVTEE